MSAIGAREALTVIIDPRGSRLFVEELRCGGGVHDVRTDLFFRSHRSFRHRVVGHPRVQAVEALRSAFLATPYRPTGLSTPARTTVRLVDELIWLNRVVIQPGLHRDVDRAALRVKEAAAAVLGRAADLLDARGGSSDKLDAALTGLAAAHAKMQEGVRAGLPARSLRPASDPAVAGPPGPAPPASDPAVAGPPGPAPPASDPAAGGGPVGEVITSLDPVFRAEELSYAVSLIARTAGLTAAAERRSWRDRWLGRQPEGVPGTLSAARERITSYLEPPLGLVAQQLARGRRARR